MRYFILWFSLMIFLLGTVNTQAQTSQSFKQALYYRDNEIWQYNPATNEHQLLFTTPEPIFSAQLSHDEQYLYLIEGDYRPATRNRKVTRIIISTGIREIVYEREGIAGISLNSSNSFIMITYYVNDYNVERCLFSTVSSSCLPTQERGVISWHSDTILGFRTDYFLGKLDTQNLTYNPIDLPGDWVVDSIRKSPEVNKVLLFMIYTGGDTHIFNQIFTLDLQTNAIEPFRMDGYYNTIDYGTIYLWDPTPNWQHVAYKGNFLVIADGNDGHIIKEWQDGVPRTLDFLAWLNDDTLFFADSRDFATYSMGDENYTIVQRDCNCNVFAVISEPIVPPVVGNPLSVLHEERP